MARSTDEINAIIAELKTRRDTRNDSIESAAGALDGSNEKIAARLRSLKHVKEIANAKEVCVFCKVIKNDAGEVEAMEHISYYIADEILGGETQKGLETLLADESFTVTGATTVENL